MKCPKCKVDLTNVNYDQKAINVDRCEKCKGVWLDRGELAQYANFGDDLPDFLSSSLQKKATQFTCPRDKSPLVQIPFSPVDSSVKNFFLDYCEECAGLWLDHNELFSAETFLKQMKIAQKKKLKTP